VRQACKSSKGIGSHRMWGCDAGVKSVAGAKMKEDKADHKHTSLL